MTGMAGVSVAAPGTFGRDGAMFEGLLDFVAQLSLVLWTVVIVTVIIRFIGVRIYRRRSRPAVPATVTANSVATETVASHPTDEADAVRPTAGQQGQSEPVARGPLTTVTAAKDPALVPAELIGSGPVDVSPTGVPTDTVEVILLPDKVSSRVTPSVQMPLHPPQGRHPEARSPALATQSVEA
ncbi:hypothetical protein [Arthrobacter sp. L77]|uniref:hypothetical protein n=1 Tax=Arthrobacter sp. L77 TaxID=1496689 RepID=UPI0005BA7D3D|nr:hypothetical protein [Arthrobacter sp. L77]